MPDAGEITVIRGLSAVPPYFTSAVRHSQGSIFGSTTYDQANDRFGAALATADFDRDGFDDLAVGIPGEDVGGVNRGGFAMLTGDAGRSLFPLPLPRRRHLGHSAGHARQLRHGRRSRHRRLRRRRAPDLAIGLPYWNVTPDLPDAGAETVLYGSMFSDGFESNSMGDWSSWLP